MSSGFRPVEDTGGYADTKACNGHFVYHESFAWMRLMQKKRLFRVSNKCFNGSAQMPKTILHCLTLKTLLSPLKPRDTDSNKSFDFLLKPICIMFVHVIHYYCTALLLCLLYK